MISLVHKNHEIALLSIQLHLIFLISEIPSSCPEALSTGFAKAYREVSKVLFPRVTSRVNSVDPP